MSDFGRWKSIRYFSYFFATAAINSQIKCTEAQNNYTET